MFSHRCVHALVCSGSTKAFLSEFGASLAPEIKSHGIDVCVVHPSPTTSNFYDSKHVTHTIDAMNFFKKTGCGPEKVAQSAFACLGRVSILFLPKILWWTL